MTEQPYLTRLTSFKLGIEPAPIKTYPVLARGKEELKEVCGGSDSSRVARRRVRSVVR